MVGNHLQRSYEVFEELSLEDGTPLLDSTRGAPWATSSPRNYLHVKITSIQYFPTRKVLEEIIGGNLQFLLPSKTFLKDNFSRKPSHQFRKVNVCKSLCHHRGGICQCRQCRRQCKIFASGVNFSIFTHFLCFFLLKLLKLGEIDSVKFLA